MRYFSVCGIALLSAAPSGAFSQVPSGPHIVLSESFENNERRFPLRPGTAGQPLSEIANGEFHGVTGEGQVLNPLVPAEFDQAKPWSITLTVNAIDGVAAGGVGIAFGASKERRQYFFMIETARRSISVLRKDTGPVETRFRTIEGGAINRSGPNRLSIKSNGGIWRLYVNSSFVGEMPAMPFYGPGVGPVQASDENARFDDLEVERWDGDGMPPVSANDTRLLPAGFKPVSAPVHRASVPASTLNRSSPYAPDMSKSYTMSASDLAIFRAAIAEADKGTLLASKTARLTGQRGEPSPQGGGAFIANEYDMGSFPTLDAARNALGPVLVAARYAFGPEATFRVETPYDSLETRYVVASANPRLTLAATFSSAGRADGFTGVQLSLNLVSASAGVPAVRPPPPPTRAPTSRVLPLLDALRRILATAPSGFAAIRDDSKRGNTDYAPGTLNIAGVGTENQSVYLGAQPRYSIGFASSIGETLAAENLPILQKTILEALGPGATMEKTETVAKPLSGVSGARYKFQRGAGPTIELSITKVTFGYSQRITVRP